VSTTVAGRGFTKVYLDAPYASVRWESRGQWVLAEWKASAGSADFRAAQEATLRAVQENHASRLLADTRDARLVLLEDERWMREDLIPRFALTGLRWTAIVTPVNRLARIIQSDVAKAALNGPSESRQFATLDEAKAWLSRVGDAG
jgi:hypothetical protein